VSGISAFRERATETESVDATTTSLDTIIKAASGLAPYATLTQLAQGVGKATGNSALQGYSLMGQPWREAVIDRGDYRAYAIYGDVIWHATASTNLTLGGRYT
jgi:iron complex outermembrane receptor protein